MIEISQMSMQLRRTAFARSEIPLIVHTTVVSGTQASYDTVLILVQGLTSLL